jgi:hypothetical protein
MNHSTYLEANGWVKSQSTYGRTGPRFYKRFSTPTRCACNHEKEGMQVCVALSSYPECSGYEIELHGELPDGTWIKLHNHGMPDGIEAGLATIPRLLATWEFIANHNQPTPWTNYLTYPKLKVLA